MSLTRAVTLATLSISVLCVLSPLVAAQTIKREPARPIGSAEGRDTFKEYCAVCHGVDGKGTGPAAPALKTPPADLTTIAKRHGGKFSAQDVQEIILGNQTYAAHGSREMPIWGPIFRALNPDDLQYKLRVRNLVEYLRSLQVP